VTPHPARRLDSKTPRRPRPWLEAERLENRTVLSYSPIGSLPDLTGVASVPPVAAYGGEITVQVDVSNIGASSLVEPLALVPGATSSADAPASQIGVYLSRNARRFDPTRSFKLGEIDVSSIRQNSTLNITSTLLMPATRPTGLPGNGGRVFVWFRLDEGREVREIDRTNNVIRGGQPVQLAAALPELAVVAFEAPPVLSPGDVIDPSFKIANFGTVDTSPQGTLLVQLVASTDPFFGPTDIVLASYNITNVPPLANAPARGTTVLGDVTLDNPTNVITVGGQLATLPSEPGSYFIGLIVDPLNTIRQISEITDGPNAALEGLRVVGPPIHGLEPASTTGTAAPPLNVFPTPAFGLLTSPFFASGGTVTSTTTASGGQVRVAQSSTIGRIPRRAAGPRVGLRRAPGDVRIPGNARINYRPPQSVGGMR
jgi:hypothetical protein